MSRIGEIGTSESKFVEMANLLVEYDGYIENIEAELAVKNKPIKEALNEQVALYGYYDQKRIELRSVVKHMETEIERVRGRLYERYKEKHSIVLGEREINQYINNEDAYLRTKGLLLEVDELYQKYTAIVEAFKQRGFALGHLSRVLVAQVEDAIL